MNWLTVGLPFNKKELRKSLNDELGLWFESSIGSKPIGQVWIGKSAAFDVKAATELLI